MEGWIVVSQLNFLTEYLDNFCGTHEKIHKKAYFYYDRGLKVYATDGCAKTLINFSREFLPFDGVFVLPVQYLKGLMRGVKDDTNELIKIIIENDSMHFEIENMKLHTAVNKIHQVPEILKTFDVNSAIPLKAFLKLADYVSSVASEGDLIDVFTDNGIIYFAFSSQYSQIISKVGPAKTEFHKKIPYETFRHIVKSLGAVRSENNINIGFNEEFLMLYISGIVLNIHSQNSDEVISVNLDDSYIEEVTIDTSVLRKSLDKLCITFPKSVKSYLVLKESESYLYANEEDSTLSWKLPVETKNQYLIQISSKKFRSMITRMPKMLKFIFNKRELIITEKNGYLIAKYPIKQYKTSE